MKKSRFKFSGTKEGEKIKEVNLKEKIFKIKLKVV